MSFNNLQEDSDTRKDSVGALFTALESPPAFLGEWRNVDADIRASVSVLISYLSDETCRFDPCLTHQFGKVAGALLFIQSFARCGAALIAGGALPY